MAVMYCLGGMVLDALLPLLLPITIADPQSLSFHDSLQTFLNAISNTQADKLLVRLKLRCTSSIVRFNQVQISKC